jgi:hypothetical protein
VPGDASGINNRPNITLDCDAIPSVFLRLDLLMLISIKSDYYHILLIEQMEGI